ncbi:YbaK/EbsC family protein [Roseibium sp. RKSG952]|uniref:YbaK/EbsC family protein n=1 Tax=Roseibium sp. RKSG952 TaxID=2529384 RepID=UPI0012BC8DE5|nr:YbaK/EbsC family protein [Roseibium sp. RKSG952]MTH94838.1 YbaK/prolyl-tRNA synthetase associated domain-containing protein [Roseibium sp. RKSG952]
MTCTTKIFELLNNAKITYELIKHDAEGQTEAASKLRGNHLNEAAKSLVIEAGQRRDIKFEYYLIVLPGDKRVNFKLIKRILDVQRLQFASEDKLFELTECEKGAVPPFSFHEDLKIIVDLDLKKSDRIVFNAGILDLSVSIPTKNYFEIINYTFGYET